MLCACVQRCLWRFLYGFKQEPLGLQTAKFGSFWGGLAAWASSRAFQSYPCCQLQLLFFSSCLLGVEKTTVGLSLKPAQLLANSFCAHRLKPASWLIVQITPSSDNLHQGADAGKGAKALVHGELGLLCHLQSPT